MTPQDNELQRLRYQLAATQQQRNNAMDQLAAVIAELSLVRQEQAQAKEAASG